MQWSIVKNYQIEKTRNKNKKSNEKTKIKQGLISAEEMKMELTEMARSCLPNTETSGFYPVIEGFYNNSPRLRELVETRLKSKGFRELPMVSNLLPDSLIEQTIKYLEEYLPALLQLFTSWAQKQQRTSPLMIRRKISPGISYRLAPLPLLLQKCFDQFNLTYAANYAAQNGQSLAVESLRILEGSLIGDPQAYSQNEIFITEGGGTNGIYTAMDYIKTKFPGAEIISCGPNYFQFFINAKAGNNSIKSLIGDNVSKEKVRFLPTPAQIEDNITSKTKALVITQPNNPTGEFYSKEELRQIIEIAKENNLLIIDDSAFEELVFPGKRSIFSSVANIAYWLRESNRVITIKSFSKGKNLPGERVGYIISKNSDFTNNFLPENTMRQRDCPSNLNTGLICLDSILRIVESQFQRGISLDNAISATDRLFPPEIKSEVLPINDQICRIYLDQRYADMQEYLKTFMRVQYLLCSSKNGGFFSEISDTGSAYNVLVRLDKIPRGLSLFEYAVNLFLQYGLETQWGPNFDNNTQRWERDYGAWMRITFSSSPEYVEDSLDRIIDSADSFRKCNFLLRTDLFKS